MFELPSRNYSQFLKRANVLTNQGASLFASVLRHIMAVVHLLVQYFVRKIFVHPAPPKDCPKKGKIAVIGGGLSGVSTAAHCLIYGWDVVLFEKEKQVGGIWAKVHDASKLQTPAFMYRPHPLVQWHEYFPQKQEILEEINHVWKTYNVEEKTRFDTPVTDIRKIHPDNDKSSLGKWIINGNSDELFDAVIFCLGQCDKPQLAPFPDEEKIQIPIYHSSELSTGNSLKMNLNVNISSNQNDKEHEGEGEGDESNKTADLKGKRVMVIGSGASAIEALEYAHKEGASHVDIIARSDKWILPQYVIVLTFVSMCPRFLSFIPEFIIKTWYRFRGAGELIPSHPLYEESPCCSDNFFTHLSTGYLTYKKGKILSFAEKGVLFVPMKHPKQEKDDEKSQKDIEKEKENAQELTADVMIFATGFKPPHLPRVNGHIVGEKDDDKKTIGKQEVKNDEKTEKNENNEKKKKKHRKNKRKSSKENGVNSHQNGSADGEAEAEENVEKGEDVFPVPYQGSNLYLQTFSVIDPTLLLTNTSFRHAVGTVGHFHIGMYCRLLLMYLQEHKCFPPLEERQKWVDQIMKLYPEKGLGFFNYGQLISWFLRFLCLEDIRRWKWIPFVLFGFTFRKSYL